LVGAQKNHLAHRIRVKGYHPNILPVPSVDVNAMGKPQKRRWKYSRRRGLSILVQPQFVLSILGAKSPILENVLTDPDPRIPGLSLLTASSRRKPS